jgi:transporter family-2 protein
MDRGLAVLLTAVAGGLIALQAPINAGLGRATGSLPAALVSFLVGTIALAAIVVLSGKVGGLGSTFDVSWYSCSAGCSARSTSPTRWSPSRLSGRAGSRRRRSPAS